MPFGQLIIGPPGSGKSTYCMGMNQFLAAMKRKPVIVNLDFANDALPYECKVNVGDFLSFEQVMESRRLGPNGSLIYCMEQLEANFSWLQDRIQQCDQDSYFLFDCPGQVELFICNDAFKRIVKKLEQMHFRLAAVNLVDSFYLIDPAKFISALVLSLQAMLQLEFPHVNVLTKIDNIANLSQLSFELEEYAEPSDLTFLVNLLDQTSFGQKHRRLTQALCELIEDFGLLSFVPFAIDDKECLAFLLQEIDKANGHVFGSLTSGNESIMEAAMSPSGTGAYISRMQKRYISKTEETGKDT